jgi:AhpD family alkylhydroperoxidase
VKARSGETTKQARLNAFQGAPELMKAVLALSEASKASSVETTIKELVKIRASQINGCAFCIEMHSREARALGETEERIYLLSGWRESPLYTVRERAALAWTESLTMVAETHAPDDVYEEARRQFSDQALTELTVAIGLINLWNRVQVGFRAIHPLKSVQAAQ